MDRSADNQSSIPSPSSTSEPSPQVEEHYPSPSSTTSSSSSASPAAFFGDDLDEEFPDRATESSAPLEDRHRSIYDFFGSQFLSSQNVPVIPALESIMRDPLFVTFSTMMRLDEPSYQLDRRSAVCTRCRINTVAPVQLLEDTKSDQTSGSGSCCICLEDMNPKDCVRKLVCGHVIHRNCVDKWVETKPQCPLCRTSIYPQATS